MSLWGVQRTRSISTTRFARPVVNSQTSELTAAFVVPVSFVKFVSKASRPTNAVVMTTGTSAG